MRPVLRVSWPRSWRAISRWETPHTTFTILRASRVGDIPAYPLAGCGEIKRFFAEQGVCDVPSWYVKIGVEPERAKRLYGNTLVAVCGPDYRHVAFVLNGCYHAHDAGFTDLLHSGLIEKMSARPDTTQALERLTDRILAFELHGDTGGLPAF